MGAVPLRARLTAIFGALVLAPDTMLLRLTRFESSSEWLTSWGIVFYRAWGRLIFLPLLYVLVHGKSGAYVDAVRALGARRLWLGAALYMVQNVAFIVAASMTYIASVLSIVATGPLCSALFSSYFLRDERVPTHTWLASFACVGWVLLIFADALESGGETRHVVGTSVALLVPIGTGAFWTFCKANPDADMVPALSTSGILGQTLALVVMFSSSRRDGDEGGLAAPLVPVSDDGGVAVTALVFQCLLVAAAFMFLTIGAKDVPSAEVSLYLLMELPDATLLVWWATGETPPWQVFVGAAGLLCTMGLESWIGIVSSRRGDEDDTEPDEAVGLEDVGPSVADG